ncbi:hypothetical protein BC829DRAFT_428905 [Chytridium lagenaria]|nr:hypothetical protein BC829DRAFT_428905 [Chytridium lagenaria]
MPIQDVVVVVGVSTLAVASVVYLHTGIHAGQSLAIFLSKPHRSHTIARRMTRSCLGTNIVFRSMDVLSFSSLVNFHPWRIPDVDRWRPILEQYKAAGLNCIRIYFHWGYHSPAEGVYHFDGNRDMDYLLSLCEELRLFVFGRSRKPFGPYICAETQAGGIPNWLVAKRHVRIRHSSATFFKKYDPEYSKYCREWLHAILPILARHQITNSGLSPSGRPGCLLALQIENENFELFKGMSAALPFLFSTTMRLRRVHSLPILATRKFLERITLALISTPLTKEKPQAWKPWKPETVTGSVDGMEALVRGFGGAAATAPIFIAELQGGWFNHYQLKCTYDTIYRFYGESYTKLLVESCFAQGVTAFNIYMFYGGTNWGTLGDPDVYTSYDYSACIREYNFLSGRARKLRLAISFARSFADIFAKTDPIPASAQTVIVTPPTAFNRQRVSLGSQDAEFTFFRNFEEGDGNLTVKLLHRPAVVLKCKLPFKQSFIALGNYKSQASGLHLLLATVPILARTHVTGANGKVSEVWFIQSDSEISGQLAFDGDVIVKAGSKSLNASSESLSLAGTSVVSFGGVEGWCSLALNSENGAKKTELYIVALAGDDVYTFNASFEEAYWSKTESDAPVGTDPIAVSWGAFNSRYDPVAGTFEVEVFKPDARVYAIVPATEKLVKSGLAAVTAESPFHGLPGALVYRPVTAYKALAPATALAQAGSWTYRRSDFDAFDWVPLEVDKKNIPVKNVIDLGFISGHSFYKVNFNVENPDSPSPIKLSMDIRNRCVVYLNNTVIGGHTTYSLQLFKKGAKNGPDPFSAWTDYVLPNHLLLKGDNRIVVMIESYGLSRQAFVLNDVRNGRGLLGVKLTSKSSIPFKLEAAGVDTAKISQPFGISGFPDEASPSGWKAVNAETASTGAAILKHPDMAFGPLWFKTSFTVKEKPGPIATTGGLLSAVTGKTTSTTSRRVPYRLILDGPGTAHVFVAGIYIARYRGNGDSVQKDFVVPDKLVENAPNGVVPVTVLVYGRNSEEWVSVLFGGWEIAAQGSLEERWSGNLLEGGKVFSTVKEVLKV